MTTIEDIIRIAVKAHEGQKDMVGNPAILHVLAVGLMGKTDLEKKAGVLHDVVEDSDITLDDLYHNLWRAKDTRNTLDTRSAERRELLGEILRIAELHDRAEKFIRRSASVFQTDVSKRKIIDSA